MVKKSASIAARLAAIRKGPRRAARASGARPVRRVAAPAASPARGNALSSRPATYSGVSFQNAYKYLACKYDAANSEPARYPDMLTYPTAVFKSTTQFSVQTAAASSGECTQMVFSPFVGGVGVGTGMIGAKCKYADTFVGDLPSNLQYVADDLGGAAGGAATNWTSYRPIAMNVAIIPTTIAQNIGGAVYAELLPVNLSPTDLNLSNATMSSRDDADAISVASLADGTAAVGTKKRPLVWSANSPTVQANFVPPSWNDAAASSILVTVIAPAGSRQSFRVEVTCVYEAIPLPALLQLFNVGRSPGSLHHVQALEAEGLKDITHSIKPSHRPTVWSRIKSFASTVSGWLSHVPGPVGTIAGAIHTVL